MYATRLSTEAALLLRAEQTGPRPRRGSLAGIVATLGLCLGGPAVAQAVNDPPQLPHEVIVFPERDFTSITGFQPNADLLVQLQRNGMVVSDAVGRTDATGLLEVNHPGGVCWRNVTPDIVAGDVVRVTYQDTANNLALATPVVVGSGDAVDTQNVTARQAYDAGDGTVVVKGRALLPDGSRIPLDRLEIRIVNADFRDPPASRLTRRDIRADSAGGRVDVPGGSATLAYDGDGLSTFTAIFTGLNDFERQLAVEGQTRVLAWQQTTAAGDRLGVTIYEVGEIGGPGFGGCPGGPNGLPPAQPPEAPVAYDPSALKDAAIAANQPALKDVIVFPDRDFISMDGFAPGTDLQVVVRRPNVGIIGTARGTAGSAGLLEVNHPGGVCWRGQTPDIRAGDFVDVFQVAGGAFYAGQTQRVIDATVTRTGFINATGAVQVNGTARNQDGSPFDLNALEQRIINPDFVDTRIGRRDIVADVNGGRVGNIAGATGRLLATSVAGEWQSVFTGLTATEQQLVLAGQDRIMGWLSTNANGDRFGVTISEAGETGGPGFGGCPSAGDFAIPAPAGSTRLDAALVMAGPAQVAAGGTAVYTLTVSNVGTVPIAQAIVTDMLPATGFASAAVAPSTGSCTTTGTTTTCQLGALDVGRTATVTVTLTGVTAAVTHTAGVEPADALGELLTDVNSANNRATINTTLQPATSVTADLEVKGSSSTNAPTLRTAYTYTWEVRNNGGATASAVKFTDALPASLQFQSVTPSSNAVTCTAPTVNMNGGTVSCSTASLAVGQRFTVTVRVAATVPGTIANTGQVGFAGSDTRPARNAATVTVTTR